jgi:hypothetical protein
MNNPIPVSEIAEFRSLIKSAVKLSNGKEKFLVTCGGKISCIRCQGTSQTH